MGKKGIKSAKGEGESWKEPKSERLNLQITATAKRLLKERSAEMGVSLAELMERISRGQLTLPTLLDEDLKPASMNQIRNSLARFSQLELSRLVEDIGRVMRIRESGNVDHRLAELVEQVRTQAVAAFSEALDGDPIQQVDTLIAGRKPTEDEVLVLSTLLNVSYQELQQRVTKEFGNNDSSHQGCGSNI